MALESLLSALREDPRFIRNVTAWRRLPAQAAQTVAWPAELDPRLSTAARTQGISALQRDQFADYSREIGVLLDNVIFALLRF